MDKIKKYAELLVRAGGNVQKGQPVVISSDISDADFARMVQDCAYDAGAREVSILWSDDLSARTRYLRAADETFDEFPGWIAERYKYWDDKAVVYLHIDSSDPDLFNGVDPDRIMRYSKVFRQNTKDHSTRTMNSELRWSVLALPSPKWAAKVFPNLPEAEAMGKLMDAILKGARADGIDPIKDWEEHHKNFVGRVKYLNEKQFETLHFTNSLGTDITIGMPENHVWAGGGDVGQDGVSFFPNLPTEEIFSAPNRNKADGKVVASMPLSYQGNLIEDFSITFKDGRAVEYSAKAGEELLKSIIEMDEGSHYLGEVALVANSSPISQMGILFYNTLFDENASCHFALGKAYPKNVKDGSNMNEEELLKAGINDSLTHVDFMFGTADMKIVATDKDGNQVVIMENGELCF